MKAGVKVNLREAEGGTLETVTEAGAVLGCVPADCVADLVSGGYAGHVRTIKRDPETKAITQIAVRFVQGQKTVQPEGEEPHCGHSSCRPLPPLTPPPFAQSTCAPT